MRHENSVIEKAMSDYERYSKSVASIAKEAGVSTRTIERWAQKYGILRDMKTAQSIASKYRDYSAISSKQLIGHKRKTIPPKLRFQTLSAHPFCAICGATAEDCALQIDHIDNDPSNNSPDNLQVLCRECNQGKFHANRKQYLQMKEREHYDREKAIVARLNGEEEE